MTAALAEPEAHQLEAHLIRRALAELIGTALLLIAVIGSGIAAQTLSPSDTAPFAVGAYITGAYFFTSSTSFANPAVTLARMLSDTFAGIAPGSVVPFIVAQVVGAAIACGVVRVLWPDIEERARSQLFHARGLSGTVRRMHRRLVSILALCALTFALLPPAALGQTDDQMAPYAIGLWGDLPYSDIQATQGVPNLIADMNDSDIEFSVHDGDLKAGSGVEGSSTPSTCSDAMYLQALGYLNSLKKPAMFTPGDNDWTDCDRPANGGFKSLERLDHERQVFFSAPTSMGQTKMQQEVQSTPNCPGSTGPTRCVENRRWTFHNVVYATVNIQGSCNNLCDTDPDPAEFEGRNAADIAWLQQTFDEAKSTNASAVMLITQADPGFDIADPTRAPLRDPKTLAETDDQPDGFKDYLLALRSLVIDYGRPVVYVHGDSHYFRIDKPLLDESGRRLENFTRLETFGDNQANGNNDVHWVKVMVDPSSREVFAFQEQIVPVNRTAVPSP